MTKYLSLFRIRFIYGLQYRAAALAGIVTQFVWGMMELWMFNAFYRSNPSAFPMSFSQLSSYIWLQQAFLAMFMMWFLEQDIFSSITGGNLAYELSRPMDLYNMWFTRSMATRLSKALLRSAPILLIAIFLPKPYNISMPADFMSFGMFIITLILAFLSVVAFSMILYIITFYTMSPTGVRLVAFSIIEFLTGSVIPLPFMPDKVRAVLELTPFATMQNLPFRIYSGNISGGQMLKCITIQVMWLVFVVAFGKVCMKKALKKVVIQGG